MYVFEEGQHQIGEAAEDCNQPQPAHLRCQQDDEHSSINTSPAAFMHSAAPVNLCTSALCLTVDYEGEVRRLDCGQQRHKLRLKHHPLVCLLLVVSVFALISYIHFANYASDNLSYCKSIPKSAKRLRVCGYALQNETCSDHLCFYV